MKHRNLSRRRQRRKKRLTDWLTMLLFLSFFFFFLWQQQRHAHTKSTWHGGSSAKRPTSSHQLLFVVVALCTSCPREREEAFLSVCVAKRAAKTDDNDECWHCEKVECCLWELQQSRVAVLQADVGKLLPICCMLPFFYFDPPIFWEMILIRYSGVLKTLH